MPDIRSFFTSPKPAGDKKGAAGDSQKPSGGGKAPAAKGKAAAGSQSAAKSKPVAKPSAKPKPAAKPSAVRQQKQQASASGSDDEVKVVLEVAASPAKRSPKFAAAAADADAAAAAAAAAAADVEVEVDSPVMTRKRKAPKRRQVVIDDSDAEDGASQGGDDDDEEAFEPEAEESEEEPSALTSDDDDDDFEATPKRKRKAPAKGRTPSQASKAKTTTPPTSLQKRQKGEGGGAVAAPTKSPAAKASATKKARPTTAEEYFSGAAALKPAAPVLKPAAAAAAAAVTAKPEAAGGAAAGAAEKPKWNKAWAAGARREPVAAGSKEIPVGAHMCLEGLSFALTGVLESLGRVEAEDLIKRYGGKVSSSVSGKTSYLLYGDLLEDGRPVNESKKYTTAVQKGTKMLTEDGLLQLIRDSAPAAAAVPAAASHTPSAAAAAAAPRAANPYANMKKPAANPYAKKPAAAGAAASGGGGGGASGKGKAAAAAAGVSKAVSSEPGQLWADKYRPQKPSDLLGHTGDVRKLTEWLNNFEARPAPAVKGAKGKGKAGDDMSKRAVLISGPPGIGKTTAATIVAKSLGFEVTEFNASDTRSKKSMEEGLRDVLSNTVLSFGSKAGSKPPKRVIIMDEVDGMGGGDRGGMGELIKLIAITKVPIICICNDRQDTKIRSLVNHCIDMRFKRPVKTMIAKRMKEVAQKEGLDIDLNAAEMLSESVGNDIRQCLHAMQMWSRGSRTMAYMEVKDGLGAVSKDKSQRVSAFDGARMIFQTKSIPQAERYEAFFTDYGLVPLLVQQNWPDAIAKSNKATMMQRMARAADAISDAELAGSMVRGDVNHWELLPLYAALHLRVGLECDGYIGFPGFPQWLGKNSAATKRRRLVAEINTHMNARVNADREAVRLDYVPVLTRVITEPLRTAGADGVGDAMAMLDEYGLSRDDLLESMADLTLKGTRDYIGEVSTAAKTALTRAYNSTTHTSQALFDEISAPKRAKKAKRIPKSLEMEGELDAEDEAAILMDDDDDDDDDDGGGGDMSAFLKKPKGRGGGAAAKAKASAAAGSKGKAAAKPKATAKAKGSR